MKSEKREISSIAQVPQSTSSSTISPKKLTKKKTFTVNVTVSVSAANIKNFVGPFFYLKSFGVSHLGGLVLAERLRFLVIVTMLPCLLLTPSLSLTTLMGVFDCDWVRGL